MKFAKSQPDVSTPSIVCIGALVIGTLSGLFGGFFIFINFRINGYRAKYNTKPWGKLVEASLFAFVTATCFYWFPLKFETCLPNGSASVKTDSIFDKSENYDVTQGWCSEGYHNPLATIMWKTEGGLIKHMMDQDPRCSKTQLFVYGAVWYFWTITTYGINVPSGLFLPGMIVGTAMGDIYVKVINEWGWVDDDHLA
jgi:chloride channel 7